MNEPYKPTAYVEREFIHFHGIRVWLLDRARPRPAVGQPAEIVFTELDETTEAPPTLHLPDEQAMGLLDALAAHYGGHSDIRNLRRDYDAERARVDKALAYLTREAGR